MIAAAYIRVSTADQNTELQIRELRAYADRQGWQLTQVYNDVMRGGKSGRPGLNSLMQDARARTFDCLLVWKLDRFGRSLVDCLRNIQALEENGFQFIAVTQGLVLGPAPATRARSGGGVRAAIDPGADPSRAFTVQAGLRERARTKDGVQPLRPEPSAPPTKEDIRPGASRRTAAAGAVLPQDRQEVGCGPGHRHPDGTGTFQRLIPTIWNGEPSSVSLLQLTLFGRGHDVCITLEPRCYARKLLHRA